MRVLSPALRWFAILLVAAAVGGASWALMRGDASSGRGEGASSGDAVKAAATAEHPPWFEMRILDDHVSFHSDPPRDPPPSMQGVGGILVDIDRGAILWERRAHTPMSPASTTKILTAIVALENLPPERLVTVTPAALGEESDETLMGLTAGEQLTVRELLTGALLPSGNDAATALAADTVGIERFVGAMNAQARALGLHDSHFISPVGLEDPAQHASPYDLAVLATVAVNHFPLFRDLVASPHEVLPATAAHKAYDLYNTNQLLTSYPGAAGIKTGWTGDAGPCLVGMAVRDGHRLVSVLLNANTPFAQTRTLLDWGFAEEGLPRLLPPPPPPATPRPAAPAPPPTVAPAHRPAAR